MRNALPNSRIFSSSRGFTLIELLIVIAILAIIFISVIVRIELFGRQNEVDSSADIIISTLELARAQTIASDGATVYGVHFETGKIVLFTGSTYTPGQASNIERELRNAQISTISLAPSGNEVVFDRIRGTTSNFGTITLESTIDPSKTKSVTINYQGQAGISGTINTTETRISDTRHLNFGSCSSIQNASTLTLTFSDTPNVVRNITMATFFNVGKSEFEWEDETSVNGSDQLIKVHSWDTTNLLSIHRDGRYNDKALEVEIDGVTVVNFAADGTATNGTLCSSMSAQ